MSFSALRTICRQNIHRVTQRTSQVHWQGKTIKRNFHGYDAGNESNGLFNEWVKFAGLVGAATGFVKGSDVFEEVRDDDRIKFSEKTLTVIKEGTKAACGTTVLVIAAPFVLTLAIPFIPVILVAASSE